MVFWSDGQVVDAGSLNTITLQKDVSSSINEKWTDVDYDTWTTVGSCYVDFAGDNDNIIFNVVAHGAMSFGGGAISSSKVRGVYGNMSYGGFYSHENNGVNSSNDSVVTLKEGFGGSITAKSGDRMVVSIQHQTTGAAGSSAIYGGACSVWFVGSVV